ncbi:MAG: hypothetical protein HYS86_04990 [Candidatus Chisholmbacteria bacterium]|nr:hypothetical protein [Candidatus Chisholmbacteria bacterium]
MAGDILGPSQAEDAQVFVPVTGYRLFEVEMGGVRRFAVEVEGGPRPGFYLAEVSDEPNARQGIDFTREVAPHIREAFGLGPGVMTMLADF